jgi:DNA polymerase I
VQPRQLGHREYHATILAPLDDVVQQLERDGVCVSRPALLDIEKRANAACVEHLEALGHWASPDLNWNSAKQVQAFLHDEIGLPRSPYNKKGAVDEGKTSTDDRALEWIIDHCQGELAVHRPNVQLIRELRRAKRIARYAREWHDASIERDGGAYATLHPSYGLASDDDDRPGARTGRFAVKNPPLNQVPSDPAKDRFGLRTAFIAPPGYVVGACDASQLEVVLLADKATRLFGTRILTDKLIAGADMHIATAKYVFGEVLGDEVCRDTPEDEYKKNKYTAHWRNESKKVRYGSHYRKSGRGFGTSLFDQNGDALGEEKGVKIVEAFYDFEPELRMLHDFGTWWTRNKGYASSALGRWTYLDGWDAKGKGLFNKACRKEANWYMQATGQEVLALALIACRQDAELAKMGFRLMLPVHDEIVFIVLEQYGAEATERVKTHIKTALELLAPLGASGGFGPNWAIAGGKG